MTLKLYFAPGACSFVPHSMLEASGAPFEASLVKIHKNEQKSREYLAVNPRGQVPALETGGEGATINQIVAIVLYLDAQFPQARFLPAAGAARAKALETLAWMNNTVHPTFTHFFMPDKFVEGDDAQAAMRAFNKALYATQLEEIQAMVDAMHEAGRVYLSGDSFGPLDAYALTLLRWGGFTGLDPRRLPVLWSHVQTIAQLPAVARAIERERLQLNVYKPA